MVETSKVVKTGSLAVYLYFRLPYLRFNFLNVKLTMSGKLSRPCPLRIRFDLNQQWMRYLEIKHKLLVKRGLFVMQSLNKETGELITIKMKGLWSHFPIQAYKILGRINAWQAQRLLACLVSYMGGTNGYAVYPSYKSIENRCGLYGTAIKKQLNLLQDLGFINVARIPHEGNTRNIYYLQECMWDTSQMSAFAKSLLDETHECIRCGKGLDRGSFGINEANKTNHWGCGGEVFERSTPGGSATVRKLRKSISSEQKLSGDIEEDDM